MTFDIPIRNTDGSYTVNLTNPMEVTNDLVWYKTNKYPQPDLSVQQQIQSFREQMLQKLSQNTSLFKTAPTVASLRAITPVWGMLVRPDSTVEWSSTDIHSDFSLDYDVVVKLKLSAVQISRQSILPVWKLVVVKPLPDGSGMIDFDFGEKAEDGDSVHSGDVEEDTEGQVVCLKDPGERKRQMKAYVRDLLDKANEARMHADAAIDRFYAEYDLSESESDFSEEDD